MAILLSIKPVYVKKIFSGEKTVEFRKAKPNYPPSLVFIYEGSPTKKIVGWFTVKKIYPGTPNEIWAKYGAIGGISKKMFFEYCSDNKQIFAFEIDRKFRFPNPLDPLKIDPNFSPPQNFTYRNYPLAQLGVKEQRELDHV